MKHASLQRVLVTPLVLLVLALAGVIYWSSQRSSDSAAREFSQKVLLNLVDRVRQTTDAQLLGARVAIGAIVPEPVYSPVDHTVNLLPFPEDAAVIEERLWTATGFFPTINNYVYFGGADGRFVGLMRLPARIELRLREPGQAQRQIISVAAPQRRIGLLRSDAYDPRMRPWYVETVAKGREHWSDVYTDFTTAEPVLTLSKPVYRSDHVLVGVASTDLSLTQLTKFFQTLSVSRNGIAYLVERSGAIIATSTGELPYRTKGGTLVRLMADQSSASLVRESYARIREWQRAGQDFTSPVSKQFATEHGIVQMGAALLRDPAGLEWITVVAAPRADFISNVTGVMYQSLGIGLVAVAMVMVLGFFLLQWVLRDIRKLTRAAESIGLGQPLQPLNILRGDEIGLLAKSFQQMERNLRTDKLTGALNRETLLSQIDFRRRSATAVLPLKFSLLFLDLDQFKPVNDLHGHDAGDRVLIETARRLNAGSREDDDVARFGGDEFVIYLHGMNTDEQVHAACRKIRDLIRTPYQIRADLALSIDASIGWATYPTDGDDIETLLQVADRRMFEKKKSRTHR